MVIVLKRNCQEIICQTLGGIEFVGHFSQSQDLFDGFFFPAFCRYYLLPLPDQVQNGCIHRQKCLRKVDHGFLDGVRTPVDSPSDLLITVCSRRIAHVIDPESSGPADDLGNLLIIQRTSRKAVIFGSFHQDHPPDGQIHSHSDCIRGDHHLRFAAGEKLRLLMAHVIGKGAVDNAALYMLFLQLGGYGVNVPSGENDQGIPRLHILRERDHFLFVHQRCHSPVADYSVFVPAVLYDLDQPLFSIRSSTDMYCLRADAHNGSCPGAAAGSVRDHLRFIDHSHIIIRLQTEHLDGGRLMPRSLDQVLLLPGHKRAWALCPVQPLILLIGQQAQGCKINACFRPHEFFYGVMRLAGIGRPDVKHEMSVHSPGCRIEIDIPVGDPRQHQFKETSVPSLRLLLFPTLFLLSLPEGINSVFRELLSLSGSRMQEDLEDFPVVPSAGLFETGIKIIDSKLPHPLHAVQNQYRISEKEPRFVHCCLQEFLLFLCGKHGDIFSDSFENKMIFLLCDRVLFRCRVLLQALKELSLCRDMTDIILLVFSMNAVFSKNTKLDQRIQGSGNFRLGYQIVPARILPENIIRRDVGPPQKIYKLRLCKPASVLLCTGQGRLCDVGAETGAGLQLCCFFLLFDERLFSRTLSGSQNDSFIGRLNFHIFCFRA